MSEINVLTVDCDCTDGCDCNIEELHLSCNWNRMEIFTELPATGDSGTMYYIGNNADGYAAYVWLGDRFQELGSATGSLIRSMTLNEYGVGKLSTAEVLSRGAVVGMNANAQLMIPVASLGAYGAVLLGSQYQPANSQPYVVGIGASSNSGTYGQLCFNLSPTQSDGSPGVLVYERVSTNPVQFMLKIKEGSASQMGVVKLLSSLNGYTDEEIDSMRNTHAASVGLVLDGLESYVKDYVNDERIGGYFDSWASGKNLSQEIWDDAEKRGALFENLENFVLGDVKFGDKVNEYAVSWLKDYFTDEAFYSMFGDDVKSWTEAKTEEVVSLNWTNKLEETIDKLTSEKVSDTIDSAISEWFSVAENLKSVSDIVVSTALDDIITKASEKSVEYTKGVFNGENLISVNGELVSFSTWASLIIQGLVNSQTSGIESKIQTAKNESTAYTDKQFISGLSKVVLHENSSGETTGTFSFRNDGYKFIAIKVAHWTSRQGNGGSYSAVIPPINIKESLSMGLGSDFAWHFDAGHPDAGIGGIVSISEDSISVSIKHRWTDYVDTRVLGIYAWK